MTRYWLGVVSKEHVKKGVKGGFAQVCHGKKGPLSKMKAGDWLIYYSPKQSMESAEPCKRFTAIGRIQSGVIYQVEMAPGFAPFRLDVGYMPSREVSIEDLVDKLAFTCKPHWGFSLRRGLLELEKGDFLVIFKAMMQFIRQ